MLDNNEKDFNFKLTMALKYIMLGFIVAIVSYYVPLIYKMSLRKPTFNEIFLISITAALTMYMIDSFKKDV